jgi:hypothetical protein
MRVRIFVVIVQHLLHSREGVLEDGVIAKAGEAEEL